MSTVVRIKMVSIVDRVERINRLKSPIIVSVGIGCWSIRERWQSTVRCYSALLEIS